MVFREVSVIEIREVLRAWLAGKGLRKVAGQSGVDRKTARSYVNVALAAGLVRDGGEGQLTDELVGLVVAAVRPARRQGHGTGWEALEGEHAQIVEWVGQDLTVVKIGDLLACQGVLVAHRTLHRYCVERTDYRGRGAWETVPVADGEPGVEATIGFMLSGIRNLEYAGEEPPRRLAAGDDRLQRGRERQPHEHVPRVHRGEDQRVHHSASPGLRVVDQTHSGEIDLALVLTPLFAADQPQAPPELRATLRILDQHIDQRLAHARLPAAA
jgi:hypothetical protein